MPGHQFLKTGSHTPPKLSVIGSVHLSLCLVRHCALATPGKKIQTQSAAKKNTQLLKVNKPTTQISALVSISFASLPHPIPLHHGLINYIDSKAKKCRHLKNLTCKGTMCQVFIRVYRDGDTVNHVGIFDPALLPL